jgi:hypothetical protein
VQMPWLRCAFLPTSDYFLTTNAGPFCAHVQRPCAADWFPTFRIRLRGWGGETCEPDFIPTDSFHGLHIFRSANRNL